MEAIVKWYDLPQVKSALIVDVSNVFAQYHRALVSSYGATISEHDHGKLRTVLMDAAFCRSLPAPGAEDHERRMTHLMNVAANLEAAETQMNKASGHRLHIVGNWMRLVLLQGQYPPTNEIVEMRMKSISNLMRNPHLKVELGSLFAMSMPPNYSF